MSVDLTGLVVCPECSNDLDLYDTESVDGGYLCSSCRIVYPVIDGISVVLPLSARNYDLEYAPVSKMVSISTDELRAVSVKRTMDALLARKDVTSWEWEDEAYWSAHYSVEMVAAEKKNWNDRIWEREPLVDEVIRALGNLHNRTILDIGCGDGQTFAALMAGHCGPGSIYVATDVSLAGLKLNRERNPHPASVYILCTASRLPFRPQVFDLVCYWGILHHTEGKARTLPADARLLKDGGYILLHEALIRPTVTSLLRLEGPHESAHEERIDADELIDSVASVPYLRPVITRQYHTPFYSLAFRGALGQWVIEKRSRFNAVARVDRVLGKIGRVIPLFSPAAMLMLIEHSTHPDPGRQASAAGRSSTGSLDHGE